MTQIRAAEISADPWHRCYLRARASLAALLLPAEVDDHDDHGFEDNDDGDSHGNADEGFREAKGGGDEDDDHNDGVHEKVAASELYL